MCGVFGFSDYKHRQTENFINSLCQSLAYASETRGSHATGIAYVNKGTIEICKQPKPASKLKFTLPKHTAAVMGHTRHTTQGSEKNNYNNHPFGGSIGNTQFAFAHNGVIFNDCQLRHELNLPETVIETDSYIGVQLLETQKELSLQSHKYMAEQIQGSYTFTTLDDRNNLYITKGSSPVSVIHFKDMGLFVYASTEQILWTAIMQTRLFGHIKSQLAKSKKKSTVDFIEMRDGEILKMASNGVMNKCKFTVNDDESVYQWYNYRSPRRVSESESLQDIIQIASSMGIGANDIILLNEMGYSPQEIEDLIYDPEIFHQYLNEMRCDFELADELGGKI